MDFRVDISGCCRRNKIEPVRRAVKRDGLNCQIVGTKTGDDNTRSLRALKDGPIHTLKSGMTIAKPISHWTDLMVRRYREENDLPVHPWRSRGATEIGCVLCGGGAQYECSPYRILRQLDPARWRQFIVDWRGGEIILALKHKWTRARARKAIGEMGGLGTLASQHPEIFDYIRRRPLKEGHRR
jgi:3'-phosphoadenosine 5'-phosphosulfate sulfotransferase (PAPS reductase)/FAD synthetase